MRIKQISVEGLFGTFDHVIPLNMKERITIIHGPNGFGKTMMLKMLYGTKSQAFALDDQNLLQKLKNIKNNSHDPWQVCCGHHLVEILALALRKAIASQKAIDVEVSRLEHDLRLAYEAVYFPKTKLYSEIRRWESNNQPFRVLCAEEF